MALNHEFVPDNDGDDMMTQRKVWQLWCALTPSEREQFVPWLEVYLVGKQIFVKRFARILLNWEEGAPSDLDVWEAMYPDITYNDARLRKLARDLCTWLEKYMSVIGLEQDEWQQKLHLLQVLDARDCPDLFQKELRSVRRNSSVSPREAYEMLVVEQRHQLKHYPKGRKRQTFPLAEQLDTWWATDRLVIALNRLITSSAAPDEQTGLFSDDELVHMLERHVQMGNFQELDVYLKVYRLIRYAEHTTEADVQTIRSLLPKGPAIVPGLWIMVLNHYIKAFIRTEASHYAQIALAFGRMGLDEGWLLVDGVLGWDRFRSLINLALKIPDDQQAEDILHRYLYLLPVEARAEAERVHAGNIAFARKEYKSVIQLLGGRSFSNSLYDVQARSQVLMSHYALEETDINWLSDQINQLIRYVKQQPLTNSMQESYHHQLRILRRLVLANSEAALARIERAIEHTRPLNHAEWLAEALRQKWGK